MSIRRRNRRSRSRRSALFSSLIMDVIFPSQPNYWPANEIYHQIGIRLLLSDAGSRPSDVRWSCNVHFFCFKINHPIYLFSWNETASISLSFLNLKLLKNFNKKKFLLISSYFSVQLLNIWKEENWKTAIEMQW